MLPRMPSPSDARTEVGVLGAKRCRCPGVLGHPSLMVVMTDPSPPLPPYDHNLRRQFRRTYPAQLYVLNGRKSDQVHRGQLKLWS